MPKKLIIDHEFMSLIHPLRQKEFEQLEKNILTDGCRDSIVTWKGIIIDGHNRYKICHKHNIPFSTIDLPFDSRNEAIVWICENQLGRRNISDETRRYLIGIQYETEKIISRDRNKERLNQYTKNTDPITIPSLSEQHTHTAKRIGADNSVSESTVRKYGQYAKSLDEIGKKAPELESDILAGKVKVSLENVVGLSRKEPAELKRIHQKLSNNEYKVNRFIGAVSKVQPPGNRTSDIGTIKQMPEFDPNAEFTKLALTIPSWIGTIEHAKSITVVEETAAEVKTKLRQSLESLVSISNSVILTLEEKVNE